MDLNLGRYIAILTAETNMFLIGYAGSHDKCDSLDLLFYFSVFASGPTGSKFCIALEASTLFDAFWYRPCRDRYTDDIYVILDTAITVARDRTSTQAVHEGKEFNPTLVRVTLEDLFVALYNMNGHSRMYMLACRDNSVAFDKFLKKYAGKREAQRKLPINDSDAIAQITCMIQQSYNNVSKHRKLIEEISCLLDLLNDR